MLLASQKQFGTSTGFDLLDCCAFRVIEYLQSCHNVVDDGSDLIFTTDRSSSKNAAIYPARKLAAHIEWQL
jgi:hypothetical protein